jgi:hypothetical protein
MKIVLEIDCTPDEARQFLGLPDLKPVQAAIMGKLEKQMLDAADAFSAESLLRTWLSLVPQDPAQMQEMFARLFRSAFGGGTGTHKSD